MKRLVKNSLKILIYFSLFFLCYKLYNSDQLKWPERIDAIYISLSFLLLCFCFVLQSLRWFLLLKYRIVDVTFKDAFISNGLTILGKYIPGKAWMIIGKAMFISKRYHVDIKTVTMLSAQNQLLALLSGIFVGSLVLIQSGDSLVVYRSILVMLILASLLFLLIYKEGWMKYLNKYIISISIPEITWRMVYRLMPVYVFYWGMLTISFVYLGKALFIDMNFLTATSFVLGSVIGILAIIAPGGIGVREGFIYSLLIERGFELNMAIVISAFSRIWFMAAEIFFFLVALFYNKFRFA